MNFVRFVKTPRIGTATTTKKSNVKIDFKNSSKSQLSMILTITTDFSPFAGSAELSCQLVSPDDSVLIEQRVQWTDTLRDIKVDIPVPSGLKEGRVVVTSITSVHETFLTRFLGGQANHIVGVKTASFPLNASRRHDTVYRNFKLPQGPLPIAEQAGETIIRHVWDAGIILSAAISYNSISFLPDELQQFLFPIFSQRPTRVLELGTGVGILGISISAAYPNAKVVMTDLSDAQPLVDENLSLNVPHYPQIKHNTSFRTLDWEERPFPEWTILEKFDLIAMADVTYNTATFVALADTLEHLLRTGSKGGKVLCCGKRRHDEEEEFWRIVHERGFEVHQRVIFVIDLEGNMRHCRDGIKKDGEQLIDFIMVSLK
jgi:ubiquinone/menaquinone biosynthesis C-methylase UbiE